MPPAETTTEATTTSPQSRVPASTDAAVAETPLPVLRGTHTALRTALRRTL